MLSSLQRGLARSALAYTPHRQFFGGLFSSLGKIFEHSTTPGPARNSIHKGEMSETELFDEDAHEYMAAVTNNPYDVEIHGGDYNTMKNFGTLDNPVIIFSANIGWRYVMCSGQNDEEEGASHTPVWFILREGPLHRCPYCGQVFKLLNLRDEISDEQTYYMHHYLPLLEEELADDDDWVQRWSFHNFAEPYPSFHPIQSSDHVYILTNADDHDRILTDPAYRLQRLAEGHSKLHTLHQALLNVEESYYAQSPRLKENYTPEDYKDLVTSELAIRKLDRVFERVQRFAQRQQLEPLEHERREKRMRERSSARTEAGYVQYINICENELRYRDYFETDYEPEEELLAEEDDYEELVVSGIFNFKNYNFIQEGLDQPAPAVMNTFEKKKFRFEHRRWNDDPGTHFIRETRMIKRYLERAKKRNPDVEINAEEIYRIASKEGQLAAYERSSAYRNYIVDEAIQQYKDYYESEAEDLEDFNYITEQERLEFSEIFRDYAKPMQVEQKVIVTPKRQWDDNKSFFTNVSELLKDVRQRVLPEVNAKMLNAAGSDYDLVPSKDISLEEKSIELQVIDLDKVFEDLVEDEIKEVKQQISY